MTERYFNRPDPRDGPVDPAQPRSDATVPAPVPDQPAGRQPSFPARPIPDVLPALPKIERYIRERRKTDRPLIGWGVYYFLLTWLTLGIYVIAVFYQRLNRVDMFARRRLDYYRSVVEYTTEYAEQTARLDLVHSDADDLAAYVKERFATVNRPINASLSVVLSFLTLGIYGLVSYYRAMRFWWEIQVTEQDFCEQLSITWMKVGIIRYPITFEPMQQLRRSFWTNFLLSLVTLGIYGIFWDYQLHTDPDKVYPEFHSSEDAVLNAARTANA